MMDVVTFETWWALNNEIIKQVTPSWSIFIQLESLSALLCKTSSLCCTLKTFHFLFVSLPLHNSLPVSKAPFPEGWSGPAWEPSESLNILSVSMCINAINVLSLSFSVSLAVQTSSNYVALCQGQTFAQLRELRKAELFESYSHQITRNFIHQIIPTSFQQLKAWLYLIKSRVPLSSYRHTLHKMVDGPQWRSGRFKKNNLLPLIGCPALNPFSILTMLSQLAVWAWRIIHNRI